MYVTPLFINILNILEMLIPIEIIVVVLTAVFGALGALIMVLFRVLGENTKAIESINMYLAEQRTAHNYDVKECTLKHGYIDRNFVEQSSKLNAHGLILAEHETKIKELQKLH